MLGCLIILPGRDTYDLDISIDYLVYPLNYYFIALTANTSSFFNKASALLPNLLL
jgi:hypothetical protein